MAPPGGTGRGSHWALYQVVAPATSLIAKSPCMGCPTYFGAQDTSRSECGSKVVGVASPMTTICRFSVQAGSSDPSVTMANRVAGTQAYISTLTCPMLHGVWSMVSYQTGFPLAESI